MPQSILLVEDDQFLQQLYLDLLKDEGYEVTAIVDGKEALEQIEHHKWSLILLDVMLPSMSGFEIITSLRDKKKLPSCPLIFMSNLEEGQISKSLKSLVTDSWIKSNMSPPDFLTKVKNAIHSNKHS